jgi:glycosyltransferase involved in cell wall biosynthesis
MSQPKIIVLTPTKNEEWIIETFIKITSLFADHIIIADQGSTDNTIAIAQKFPKVIVIENSNLEYDEEHRQNLLTEESRKRFPGNNLLLALDADEIITAKHIDSKEWDIIKNQKTGTQIFFYKPDVMPSFKEFVVSNDCFLIGFIDDGRKHEGLKIHSPRVPYSDDKYIANDIQFMHLAITREIEYFAKQRLYVVTENLNKIDSLKNRYKKYANFFVKKRIDALKKEVLPIDWIQYGNTIDLKKIKSSVCNSYNKNLIDLIKKHGEKRFWLDDIWDVDYHQLTSLYGYSKSEYIKQPPLIITLFRNILIRSYYYLLMLKK